MRTWKKIICLALGVLMLLGGMFGCGQAPASGGESSEASSGSKAAETSAETNEADAENKPVLKYLGQSATFDLSDNPMIPLIEEKTGYQVEYEALPAGDEGETKLMMLIASSSKYDIMNLPPSLFDRAYAAGFTQELDGYLEQTTSVLEAVPEDSASWERVTIDGKIWGIPQLKPSGETLNAIVYRKDILNGLGLKEPTTPDELREVLQAVKEAYPDMIPFTTNNVCAAPPIESGFDSYHDWFEVDGELVAPQNRPETKAYIQYMAGLYQDGLMDPEFPANDDATRLQKFTSGNAFMTYFGYYEGPGFYSALETAVPEAEIGYIPYLKDENGNAGALTDGCGLEKVAFIPRSAEHPEDAMKWIDAFASNFQELYLGTEGESYTLTDGKYEPIMPEFSVHDTVWWFMPLVQEDSVFDMWQARIRKNEETERGYMDTFALHTADLNVETAHFLMDSPDEEYTKLSAKLRQYWDDEKVKLITGAVSFDTYDSIVQKWEDDGGAKLTEMANQMMKE